MAQNQEHHTEFFGWGMEKETQAHCHACCKGSFENGKTKNEYLYNINEYLYNINELFFLFMVDVWVSDIKLNAYQMNLLENVV